MKWYLFILKNAGSYMSFVNCTNTVLKNKHENKHIIQNVMFVRKKNQSITLKKMVILRLGYDFKWYSVYIEWTNNLYSKLANLLQNKVKKSRDSMT